MQNTEPPADTQLRRFQQMNCIGCRYADDKDINQVKACCNRPEPPEIEGEICLKKKSRTHRR